MLHAPCSALLLSACPNQPRTGPCWLGAQLYGFMCSSWISRMQACRRPQLHGRGHELLGFLLSLLLLYCSQPAWSRLFKCMRQHQTGGSCCCQAGTGPLVQPSATTYFSTQLNTELSEGFFMPCELCCLADRGAAAAAGGARLSQGLCNSSVAQTAFAGGAQVNSMNKACQQHAKAQCLGCSDTGIELGFRHYQHDSFTRHAVQDVHVGASNTVSMACLVR